MHVIRKPIIVNGKRIGPNKAAQSVSIAWIHKNTKCSCEACRLAHAMTRKVFGDLSGADIDYFCDAIPF